MKGVYTRTKPAWNKGLKGFRAGVKHTDQTKAKIADKATGRRHSDATKQKLSAHFTGKPISEEHRAKIQASMKAKFASILPDPRRLALQKIRRSTNYKHWREAVLEKDGHQCVLCGETDRTKLTVDHKKPLNLHPELALDVNNGRVLCCICHLYLPTHGVASRQKHEA